MSRRPHRPSLPTEMPRQQAEDDGSSNSPMGSTTASPKRRTKFWIERVQVNETGFSCLPTCSVVVLRSLHRMDAALGLVPAAPAAGARVVIRRGPACTRHTPYRQIARCDKWMRRQLGRLIDRLDLLARKVGERIEFQPHTVLLDNRDHGAGAALKSLAPVYPGPEWLQRARQRLHLADAAAGVRIGKPEIAFRIFACQRFFQRLDRADIGEPERLDQRVAVGKRLLEQPAGVEKDHGD